MEHFLLVAYMCLSGTNVCKNVSFIAPEEVKSIQVCMLGAQPMLAKYMGENPGWDLISYTCMIDESKKEDI